MTTNAAQKTYRTAKSVITKCTNLRCSHSVGVICARKDWGTWEKAQARAEQIAAEHTWCNE